MKVFVLFLLLIMAAPLRAAILFSDLSHDQQLQWEKILLKGKVDSSNYYLLEQKNKDLASEFMAAQSLLIQPNLSWGRFKMPIACVFPARMNFLKKLKLISPDIGKGCIDYEEWKKGINAKSISVVFSSAYVNNPASAFGHTFLRFNQLNKKSDLLDYSAAYSANIYTDDWGPVYVFKGMTGGYNGSFSLEPYYMKVNSYNDFEGRDLLEYELNLTTNEVSLIVDVLWELYNTGEIKYFFLTENCSSVLGALLEAGRPDLNLSDVGWWYYLPSELMSKLSDKDMIGHISYRPSLKKKIEQKLSQVDEGKLKKYYQELLPIENLNTKEQDALLALAEYRQIERKNNETVAEKKWYADLLLSRSHKRETESLFESTDITQERPELSHFKRKIHIGVGNVFQFKFFNGQHDLLDHDRGQVPFSQFTIIGPSFSYYIKEKKWSAKDSEFVSISALPIWRFYDKKISWRVQTGIRQQEIAMPGKDMLQITGSAGYSLGNEYYRFSHLIGGHVSLAENFKYKSEFGPLYEMLFAYNILPLGDLTYKGLLLSSVRKNFWHWNDKIKAKIGLGHGFMGTKGQIILEHAYETTGDFSHQFKVGFYF